jgi:general secretion pathway protein A
MNLAFYGLQTKPFETTPDPRFLYLAPGHREALAQLTYGLQESKGFILLTAEVGMGKTTLLHALLKRLDAKTAVAFVFNTTLAFDQILEYILEDLGIPRPGESQAQRLFALKTFLTERCRAGLSTVLIVDEAQNLSPETLEQIRLLSNFETSTEKLLQIVLVGQPELRAKLNLPELRQLKQRIALLCQIPPLTAKETRDYVRTRLRVAGTSDLGLFAEPALARIASYTRGVPRLLNIVCDHCLLIGYADQKRRIDRDIVDEAIAYLQNGSRRPRRRPGAVGSRVARLTGWTALGLVGLLGLAAAGAVLHPAFLDGLGWAGVSEWARMLREAVLR